MVLYDGFLGNILDDYCKGLDKFVVDFTYY